MFNLIRLILFIISRTASFKFVFYDFFVVNHKYFHRSMITKTANYLHQKRVNWALNYDALMLMVLTIFIPKTPLEGVIRAPFLKIILSNLPQILCKFVPNSTKYITNLFPIAPNII